MAGEQRLGRARQECGNKQIKGTKPPELSRAEQPCCPEQAVPDHPTCPRLPLLQQNEPWHGHQPPGTSAPQPSLHSHICATLLLPALGTALGTASPACSSSRHPPGLLPCTTLCLAAEDKSFCCSEGMGELLECSMPGCAPPLGCGTREARARWAGGEGLWLRCVTRHQKQ